MCCCYYLNLSKVKHHRFLLIKSYHVLRFVHKISHVCKHSHLTCILHYTLENLSFYSQLFFFMVCKTIVSNSHFRENISSSKNQPGRRPEQANQQLLCLLNKCICHNHAIYKTNFEFVFMRVDVFLIYYCCSPVFSKHIKLP